MTCATKKTSQSSPAARASYRADIDGLRAVAVLAVLAFHVGFAWVPGGYVGVDVFFVISGYLISAIVQQQVRAGEFSLEAFYARRIRRIFPAFLAMAVVTSGLAYHYFYPADLRNYAHSLIAAALSASNIYFWSAAGYFDASSSTQPLLHTWSLGVEEQFYLFLPLAVCAAYRKSEAAFRLSVYLTLACSLIASCVLVFHHANATFYLLPTRAWELLMGTALSFPLVKNWPDRKLREVLSLCGAGMILFAMFGLSATTPFPGAAALIPCLGSALILKSGEIEQTLVHRTLSIRPLRFIGLISYSLYLWHWPIIVFQHQYALLVPNQTFLQGNHQFLLRNVVIIVTSFLVAAISWRFVEQPVRFSRWPRRRRTVLVYGVSSAVVLCLLGCTALLSGGFAGRFPPRAIQFASYLDYGQEHLRPGQCFIGNPGLASSFDKASCLHLDPGKRAYLLVGDSTAADLWYGLSRRLDDADILQATAAGCKPVLSQPIGAYSECTKVITYALTEFLPTHPVSAVILSARWTPSELPRLANTIHFLREHGAKVIVIGPRMAYRSALPRLLALSEQHNDPGLPQREILSRSSVMDDAVQKVAAGAGASYISMYDLFCEPEACLTVLPGNVPLQFDDVHFTREGSLEAARRLAGTHLLR